MDSLKGYKIVVFEDLVPGLLSSREAARILREKDLEVELFSAGVSKHQPKIEALSRYSDCVIPDINEKILPGIIF